MRGIHSLLGLEFRKRFFDRFLKLFVKNDYPNRVEFLFCGLGNIGEKYESTRHNVGFRVADALIANLVSPKSGSFGNAQYYFGKLFGINNVIVIKPTTYMNRSGEAVGQYVKKLNLSSNQVVVIVDDYHINLGKLRIRKNGSDGGHNGLKSLISAVGPDFPRIRFGVGPLPEKMPSIDFVLGTFSAEEEKIVQEEISRAVEAIQLFVSHGINPVMNKYNS